MLQYNLLLNQPDTDLRLEALDDVTTVPGFARVGGDPSTCWKLLRGVEMVIDSASTLPRFPETITQPTVRNILPLENH